MEICLRPKRRPFQLLTLIVTPSNEFFRRLSSVFCNDRIENLNFSLGEQIKFRITLQFQFMSK